MATGRRRSAFLFASTAAALRLRPGLAVLVAQRRCLADFGAPYGHGLVQLGLDAGRLLLVETKSDKDALWALEEALRSRSAAGHGRRRRRGQSRSDHQPPAEPRRRRSMPRRSCSCAASAATGTAPPPRAGASPPHRRPSTASARSRTRDGAWRWSAAATDVPGPVAYRVGPCRASFPFG